MFKKLKSLFVVEDEAAVSPQSGQKPAQKTTQKTPTQHSSTAKGPGSQGGAVEKPKFDKNNPPKGKPSEKFINRLLGALEENNLKGFDYLEYKQSLQNLSNVEMDEATKYKSALAMAKTMGATPKKMIDSANHYIKVLNNEETKFVEAFKNQQNIQVSNRNKEITSLEKSIAHKQKQIEQLNKEIEAEKKALDQRKNSINQANAKVQATKESFYHAYHIVIEQIKADVEKMNKYLS